MTSEDARRFAPAVTRNKAPITEVLARHLPTSGMVLEVASGSGEHALHFAAHFPALTFQPTDPDHAALASIAAWRAEAQLANLLPPLVLDVMADPWPIINFVRGVGFIHQTTNLSPNRMANWVLASYHSRGGRLQSSAARLRCPASAPMGPNWRFD
jgi:hypothetical protein